MALMLPDHVDSHRLAASRARLAGAIQADRFTRVSGLYRVDQTAVELDFELDDMQQPRITGWLRSTAYAQCQRCLNPVSVTIECELAHVVGEEYAVRADHPAHGKLFDLLALIEDELMLSCPMIPLHPVDACRPPGDPALVERGGSNPFDVLTPLRQTTP